MLTQQQKQALASLNSSDVLTGALEVIKKKFLTDIYHTEEHESKKRDSLYLKARLVDELRSVINDAVNKSI